MYGSNQASLRTKELLMDPYGMNNPQPRSWAIALATVLVAATIVAMFIL